MKRPACKNDNPASKRKYVIAVQPVQHGSKTSASRAAEPASILDEDWQKVAYIACPSFHYRQNLIQAIRNAIEAGADIIKISFQQVRPQSATNPDAKLLEELTSVFDAEWVSSAGQPAYAYRKAGAVTSLLSVQKNYRHSRRHASRGTDSWRRSRQRNTERGANTNYDRHAQG